MKWELLEVTGFVATPIVLGQSGYDGFKSRGSKEGEYGVELGDLVIAFGDVDGHHGHAMHFSLSEKKMGGEWNGVSFGERKLMQVVIENRQWAL